MSRQDEPRLSRRQLLERATLLVGAAALADLPRALRVQGWLDSAYAAGPTVVEQTMSGLVAFVVPGRDRYSRTQGTTSRSPGGIEAGATRALIRTLDRFLPANPPLSAAAATILNEVAANVSPTARNGIFASPFANLSLAKKAKVFETLEGFGGEQTGLVPYPAGVLTATP